MPVDTFPLMRGAHVRRLRRSLASSVLFALCVALAGGATVTAHAADEVAGYYEDAQARFNRGDFGGAIVQLKNALQENPRHLPSLVLLGECYVANGDGPAAESTFNEATAAGADQALTAVPRAKALLLQFRHRELLKEPLPTELPPTRQAELLEVKADAALQLNDRKALQKILRSITDLHVNSAGELSIRATLAMREGKLDEAAKLVDTALSAQPRHPLTWLTRASLSHVRNELPQALREYGEVVALDPANMAARLARIGLLFDLGRFDEVEEDFAFFEKRDAKDPRFMFLKAIKAQHDGDPRQSREVLDEAGKVIEILGSDIVSGNVQLLMVAGIANYQVGNKELAETYLENYAKFARGETLTRRMLASLKIDKKQYGEAIKILNATLEEVGDTPELLTMLGRAYSADGQHQRATAVLERAATLRPDDPQVQTSLAMSRAMKGQTDAAMAALSNVFEKTNQAGVAGLPLAILRLNRGDYAGGEAVAADLVTAEPDNLTYLNLRGVALVGLGRFAEARATFERALSLNGKYGPALLNLAKLARREGHFDEADRRLQALLKAAPKDSQVMLELARNHEARGQRDEAVKWARAAAKASPESFEIANLLSALLTASKDYEGARNVLFEQENLYPQNLHVMNAKSAVLVASGHLDELRPHLKKMAETAEFNLEWLRPISEQQIAHGFVADARYTLFKALQEKPQDVPLRARMGDVELALGNPAAAATLADKIVSDEPAHPAGYALRGDIANSAGKFLDAAAAYAEARTKPGGDRPEIALKQHMALRAGGDGATAEQVLTEWQAVHPEDRWPARLLAEQALEDGRLPLARSRFENLLNAVPDDHLALNNLANVLIQQEEYTAAVARAKAAVALAADNPLYNDTLGWALVKAGNPADGLGYLREARTRAATLPEIRYHLAVALHRLGRSNEALAELRDALGEDVGDFAERQDALRLKAEIGG